MQHSDSSLQQAKLLTFDLAGKLIRKVPKEREQLILALTLETGCTTDDLMFLQYDDLDFSEQTITFSERTTKLSPQLCDALKRYGTPGRLYFFSTKERPQLNPRAVQRVFNLFSRLTGHKATNQSFRHLHREVSA